MSENEQKEADVAFLLDAAQEHIDPEKIDLARNKLFDLPVERLHQLRNYVNRLLDLGFTRINLLRLRAPADWIADPGAEELLKTLAT